MTIIPSLMKHLIERPGAPYAQLIRTENRAQTEGEVAPDYIRDSASIPVGDNPFLEMIAGNIEGDRYLTGFGLIPEVLAGYGPGLQGATNELLSQSNPMIKAPLEMLTGHSFWQRELDGRGKRLEDIDPPVGRLIGNVMGSDQPVQLPSFIEQIIGNSPAAVAISKAKQLTDPRNRSDYGALPVAVPDPASIIGQLTA